MSEVLLVRLSAMGDLVQSLGAVASLRAVRPQWRVTIVTQPEWTPLLQGVEGLHDVIPFARRGGVSGVLALRRALRGRRFEHVLDLQGNWKSTFVACLASAHERIGMAGPWRQEPVSRLLLSRTVSCDAVPHPARAAWELVKAIAPEAPFRLASLVASGDELQREAEALRRIGVDPARAFSVVVVTDPADPRALRAQLTRELVGGIEAVVAVIGPAEAGLGEEHVKALGLSKLLRHGAGELRRLVALGGLVGASGGEVLGPDQGATHVLLAAGAPGRVVMGSQDPRRTAPPRARVLVRRDPPSCQPCGRRRCHNPAGAVCMEFGLEGAREVPTGLPRQ